jgi:preprotein translocase subunit YajC
MIITPAYAQSGAIGGPDFLISILPFILIFAVIYFLIIRPQNQRMKQHKEMIGAVRRGDTVVTSGGIVGKVAKVTEDEATVEIADGVKVRVIKSTISDVRSKTEPANEN